MPIEGELLVTLHWDGRRVRHLKLVSTRPEVASRLLRGRRPADAAALVPRLYAICGRAQGAACSAALRAAGATTLPAPAPAEVMLEAMQETLWRLLIDAPRALGLPPATAAAVPARAAVARATAALGGEAAAIGVALADAATTLGAIAHEHVYGCDAADWLRGIDLTNYDGWCATAATAPARALQRLATEAPGLGRSDTTLMPALDDEAWERAVVPALLRDPLFAQQPLWDGRPVETGALARCRTQPLVAALIARDGHAAATRLAARLVELAQLLLALPVARTDAPGWVRAWTLQPGIGLAAVQTARGLLLHLARLADDGAIADYRIVAPTEWNFHPQGALFSGIVGSEATDEATLAARAALAVQALDPCVGFRIEVRRDA